MCRLALELRKYRGDRTRIVRIHKQLDIGQALGHTYLGVVSPQKIAETSLRRFAPEIVKWHRVIDSVEAPHPVPRVTGGGYLLCLNCFTYWSADNRRA